MKKWFIFFSFVLTLGLAGCGKDENNALPSEAEEDMIDWKSEGFRVNDEVGVDEALFMNRYQQWEHCSSADDAENISFLESGVYKNIFWHFGAVLDSDGLLPTGESGLYILDIYDTEHGSQSRKSFTPKEIGVNGKLGYLTGMDMLNEEEYMFRWAEYTVDGELYFQSADKIIFTDLAGNNRITDFTERFMEEGIEPYTPEILPLWPCEKCHGTPNGNIWILQENQRQKFYLFNQEAELIYQYEPGKHQVLSEPIMTEDGEIILPVYDDSETNYCFYWLNMEKEDPRLLGILNEAQPDIKIYGMAGNNIFYQTVHPDSGIGQGVVKWNIKSGERKWILNYDISGFGEYETLLSFLNNEPYSVFLSRENDNITNDWIVSLSDVKGSKTGNIRVADLTGGGNQAKNCAAYSSMGNPYLTYQYEDASSSEDKDKIMLELSQGKGPEFMFVSMDDFYSLSEKGLLLELGSCLPDNIQAELLPAALEIGKVDNKLLGIPAGVHIETLAVGKENSNVTQWELENIIQLMEQGKINTAIRSPYIFQSDYLQPEFTVQQIINYAMTDSFLIDWEENTGHFTDERFIRLLELTADDMSDGAAPDNFDRDLVWGYLRSYIDLMDFMARINREEGKIVGYPGQINGGSYLVADGGILVVNANMSDAEAVSFFINNMLSREIQYDDNNLCLSVRKLVPEDFLTTDEEGKQFYFGVIDAETMETSDGGDNVIRQAADFMEQCEPRPVINSAINEIILEELNQMYMEGITAKATAEKINNRVQLFLDEQY